MALSNWTYEFEKDPETDEMLRTNDGNPIRMHPRAVCLPVKAYIESATFCLNNKRFVEFGGFIKKLETLNRKDSLDVI